MPPLPCPHRIRIFFRDAHQPDRNKTWDQNMFLPIPQTIPKHFPNLCPTHSSRHCVCSDILRPWPCHDTFGNLSRIIWKESARSRPKKPSMNHTIKNTKGSIAIDDKNRPAANLRWPSEMARRASPGGLSLPASPGVAGCGLGTHPNFSTGSVTK